MSASPLFLPFRKFATSLALASALVASGPLFAAQRTFVASYGLDVNPCSLASPCRTFNVAIGNTNPGGEVVILDTAGYGPMTITKSIKIIGPSGVYGGISVLGDTSGITTGIVINAADTDDITLRGLDISGVTGGAPLPLIGIDIQNAGGVHIEKTSVGNFTPDAGACIKVNTATTVRVFITDSFLRECRTGVYANGTAVITNRPSVMVDNTRIERGRGAVASYGVWVQGYMDFSFRNGSISRQDVGIQFDNLLAGVSHVEIINSEISRSTTGLLVTNATASASPQVSIIGSQFFGSTNAMMVSNSAIGGNTYVKLADSYVAYMGTNGLVFANSAPDLQTRMGLELVRSQINHITSPGAAIDLSATNGCQVQLDVRDSTLANAGTLLKTSGTASFIDAAIVRSNLHHATTAISHGQGSIQLDSAHVNYNLQDFVNNGSGTIVSNGYNMVYNNINAPGPTYITPSVILLK